MWKKFEIYSIKKKMFWSEKAVRSTQLYTKRCFFAIQGGGYLNDSAMGRSVPGQIFALRVWEINTKVHHSTVRMLLSKYSVCSTERDDCQITSFNDFLHLSDENRYIFACPPASLNTMNFPFLIFLALYHCQRGIILILHASLYYVFQRLLGMINHVSFGVN